MKRVRAILVIVALLLLAFALARGAAILMEPEYPALAIVASHDLGRIPVGQARSATLMLSNKGNVELLLIQVKGNCECAIATLPSKAIAPGSTMPLEVTFTAKRAGKRKQHILISTNDPVNPVTVLTVIADVYDPAATMPATAPAGMESGK